MFWPVEVDPKPEFVTVFWQRKDDLNPNGGGEGIIVIALFLDDYFSIKGDLSYFSMNFQKMTKMAVILDELEGQSAKSPPPQIKQHPDALQLLTTPG